MYSCVWGRNSASLSYDLVQEQIPAIDFVRKYENVFAFKYVP
jgi:hypothetical protein